MKKILCKVLICTNLFSQIALGMNSSVEELTIQAKSTVNLSKISNALELELDQLDGLISEEEKFGMEVISELLSNDIYLNLDCNETKCDYAVGTEVSNIFKIAIFEDFNNSYKFEKTLDGADKITKLAENKYLIESGDYLIMSNKDSLYKEIDYTVSLSETEFLKGTSIINGKETQGSYKIEDGKLVINSTKFEIDPANYFTYTTEILKNTVLNINGINLRNTEGVDVISEFESEPNLGATETEINFLENLRGIEIKLEENSDTTNSSDQNTNNEMELSMGTVIPFNYEITINLKENPITKEYIEQDTGMKIDESNELFDSIELNEDSIVIKKGTLDNNETEKEMKDISQNFYINLDTSIIDPSQNYKFTIDLIGKIENNQFITEGTLDIIEPLKEMINYLLESESSKVINIGEVKTNEDYEDINKNDWYYDEMNTFKRKYISTFDEYSEKEVQSDFGFPMKEKINKIIPNKDITRAEFVDLVLQYTDIKYIDEYQIKQFEDLETDHKFYNSIQEAVQLGIIKGDSGKNTVRPNDTLNRAEAITILERAFPSLNQKNNDLESLRFTDIEENSYYIDALKEGVYEEIIKGTSETTFSPGKTLNRAEAITMLNRLYDKDSLILNIINL